MSSQIRGRLLQIALLLGFTAGCASVGAEFRPYKLSSPHRPILDRAVSTERGDVPSLARAGAIIIGNITARGNGFAGPGSVEEVAALEAARRGGTHLVAEDTSPGKAQAVYQPGAPITRSFLVIRLGDAQGLAELPERLQPRRGYHYIAQLSLDPAESIDSAPEPPPSDRPSANVASSSTAPALRGGASSARSVPVIDGSHLKPIPRPTSVYDDQ